MSDPATHPRVPRELSQPITENLQKLAALFPAAVKDGALDMEALREELGEFAEIRPGDEKYELNWVGKQAAKKEAFAPLLGKTLAFKPDESKDPDTTENLYIEGDNLEALKLLRQNYYGEVKMIYIDPPYNTGKDFVYTDKFKVSEEESAGEEGAVSTEGKRLIKNEKSSNRFHARWLDGIYPLLRLAKDLLNSEGFIFISIDDNEYSNLKAVCDEVFGADNFCANFLWRKKSTTSNVKNAEVSPQVDYQLCYRRSMAARLIPRVKLAETRDYPEQDSEGDYRTTVIEKKDSGAYQRATMNYPIMGHKPRPGKRWQIGEAKARELEERNRFIWDGEKIKLKIYSFEEEDTMSANPNLLLDCGSSDGGSRVLNIDLFEIPEFFDNPKPPQLIKHFASLVDCKSDLILDFFSGSATTAHAVMQLNAEDGGKRRHIMVQLPEVCDEKSEAAKAGYKSIVEIGRERIRRAGEMVKKELREKAASASDKEKATNPYLADPDSLDIGFKAFRIEDTKINWIRKDLRGEEITFQGMGNQDALDFVSGFTDEDIVYEVMLRQSNIPLTQAITKPVPGANGKRTYLYGESYLISLEETVTKELIETLAALEPTPLKYFFRDSAFGKDIALKDETFRRLNAEITKNHGDQGTAYTVEFI
jgi:adenine-specific DNA-methyltransferase